MQHGSNQAYLTNDGHASQIAHTTIDPDLDGTDPRKSILSQQNPLSVNDTHPDAAHQSINTSLGMQVKRLRSNGEEAVEMNLTDIN